MGLPYLSFQCTRWENRKSNFLLDSRKAIFEEKTELNVVFVYIS